MRINNNISALTAHNNLTRTDSALSKNLEKLSSGLRINRAADDAAGLAISEKMRGQIKGLDQATRNAQDGISLIQTAEGALNETHSILQRMRELTVQAGNGTNEAEDLTSIQTEIDALTSEITDIAGRTEFNQKTLLTGTYETAGSGISLQIGANTSQTMEILIGDMQATALGDGTTTIDAVDVTDSAKFSANLDAIDGAIGMVSEQRSNLGAMQNRLEHTINNLSAQSENLTAAESRVRDLDMAKEMAGFTKNQVLMQAGTSMLAQANAKSQGVLSLLG